MNKTSKDEIVEKANPSRDEDKFKPSKTKRGKKSNFNRNKVKSNLKKEVNDAS